MKSFILALLIGPITLLSQRIPVALLDFDAFGISEVEAAALSNRLRNELFNLGKFSVVERGMMADVLREQDFQQSGCTSDECLVEVGMLLGAELMIGGSVSKVGETFTVSARLIDVESGELIRVSDFDLVGRIDDMLTRGMGEVALKLSREGNANREPAQVRPKASVEPSQILPPANLDQNISLRFGLGVGHTEVDVYQPKAGLLSFSGSVFYPLSQSSVIGVQFIATDYGIAMSLAPVYVRRIGTLGFQIGLSYVINESQGLEIPIAGGTALRDPVSQKGVTSHIGIGYHNLKSKRKIGVLAFYNYENSTEKYLSGGGVTLEFEVFSIKR